LDWFLHVLRAFDGILAAPLIMSELLINFTIF